MCYYLIILLVHISNDKSYIYIGKVVLQSKFNIRNFEVASTTRIFSDVVSKVSLPTGFIVISENFELISDNSKLVWAIQKLLNATIKASKWINFSLKFKTNGKGLPRSRWS